MKTSSVLASLFLSSLAAAAPVNKRDLFTKTEVVMETVVITTTIYDGEDTPATAAAGPTSTPGLFYENRPTYSAPAQQPARSSQAPAVPSPSSIYTPPAVTTPAYTPPAVSTPAYTPPAPSAVQPSAVQPVSSAVAQQPSAAQPSQPAQTGGSTGGSGSGQYSGDITIYDSTGADGACGNPVSDTDMSVALSKDTWGASTYNVMTGAATNKWCGQKIRIFYKGNSVDATITDLCPGCKGADIDLTMAVWSKLTGTTEKTRYQATWSPIN